MIKSPYQLSPLEVASAERSDLERGLAPAEVGRRLAEKGPNTLPVRSGPSILSILIEQFRDFLILILLAAAVVSIFLGELIDGILIMVIVIAVAFVGFLNEYKAERTLFALRQLAPLRAKVVRGGVVEEVEARELVPGELVLLEEGQRIPADIRLSEAILLQTNEAPLTGESQPIQKQVDAIGREAGVGDRLNMVFSGTIITSGKGRGIVVATGLETEIGKIASLVRETEEEETPMQRKLSRLGKQLGYGILLISAVVFAVIFFFDREIGDSSLAHRLTFAFIAAVALAVAAIPEGLAFVVRISLALGARRMAHRGALVRHLPAVEALGSTDTICADKTGTLTTGEMTVRTLWVPGTELGVTGSGYQNEGEVVLRDESLPELPEPVRRLLELGVLCNNAAYHESEAAIVGDPTEGALLVSAAKAGYRSEDLKDSYPRETEVPFTSDRKLMSTIHRTHEGGRLVATKGAAEAVLTHCSKTYQDGRVVPLSAAEREKILAQDQALSEKALRVLAFAYRESEKQLKPEEAESDLVFVGLQGMMDPPRLEIRETVEAVSREAGITVIMVTGDHAETAKSVAREIGIKGDVLTGADLDRMTEAELRARVEGVGIYARVSPEHKLKIVRALQSRGRQVAMTGDGVNDAPAIKAADIGIAMGKTGTDVAKEAADMVLLDDHFLTIVRAVEEGRGIYDNVRKFVNYLISCNVAEVFIVFSGILAFGKLVLLPLQLLFINVVTDGLPAVALGSDPAERTIMRRRPGYFQEGIINTRLLLEMLLFGGLMALLVLVPFTGNVRESGTTHAVAVAFTATVVLELVRLVGLRSDYKISWLSNPWLILAIISSLALQLAVIYIPFVSERFGAVGIEAGDWVVIAVSGIILFGAMKGVRALLSRVFPGARAAAGRTGQHAVLKA